MTVKEEMMSLGWELAREDEPGIYVRSPENATRNQIDWAREPENLWQEIQGQEIQGQEIQALVMATGKQGN